MYEKPKYQLVSVEKLELCLENFRFLNPVNSETEAILEMLNSSKVGPTKIKNLVKDIFDSKSVLEDFIVLNQNESFIVYDGNRRLTALKLFKEENLNAIKGNYGNLHKYISEIKKQDDISSWTVNVKVYTKKPDMLNHIKKLHSGEQEGIGQISWGRIEKENFKNQLSNSESRTTFSNELLEILLNKVEYKHLYDAIINNKIASTIDRIFGYSTIKSRIFKLKKGSQISLNNDENLKKVCEMIEFFILNNSTVQDVYFKETATDYFESISSINGEVKPIPKPDINIKNDIEGDDEKPIIVVPNDVIYPNTISLPEVLIPYSINLELLKKMVTINEYDDYDLTNLINTAYDNDGQNLVDKVTFVLNGKKLVNNIFSGETAFGKHNIQVKLENNGLSISKSLIVNVKKVHRNLSIPKNNYKLFVPNSSLVKGDFIIDISDTVNEIISEIVLLEQPKKFPFLIASSIRQLIERSLDILIQKKSLSYKKADTDSFVAFINELKNDKTLIGRIVVGENRLGFQETQNFIKSLDPDALIRFLHLITHNSSNTFYEELENVINKKITPLLIIFHNYLHLPVENK